MKHAFPIVLTLLAAPAIAGETRELDAHEHGVGTLNIAIEGGTIAMEFRAPGADIVGFEHAAESADDRAAIDAAVASLAKPLELFVLPASAECSVVEASAKLETEGALEGHDHANDDHADEGHDDHAEVDGHDHGHDHEAYEDEARHSEFHAAYMLTCGNPDAVSEVTFAYFDMFENAREVDVQVVTSSGAQAFEVDRETPTLDLRGMF